MPHLRLLFRAISRTCVTFRTPYAHTLLVNLGAQLVSLLSCFLRLYRQVRPVPVERPLGLGSPGNCLCGARPQRERQRRAKGNNRRSCSPYFYSGRTTGARLPLGSVMSGARARELRKGIGRALGSDKALLSKKIEGYKTTTRKDQLFWTKTSLLRRPSPFQDFPFRKNPSLTIMPSPTHAPRKAVARPISYTLSPLTDWTIGAIAIWKDSPRALGESSG